LAVLNITVDERNSSVFRTVGKSQALYSLTATGD